MEKISAKSYCLQNNAAHLLSQCNLSENAAIDVEKVSYASHKKIWWQCKKGHKWQSSMPYLPENIYSDLRRLSMFRDQLCEDRIRCLNRLHREMKIYFPEYKDALGKVDGVFCLELLRKAPYPEIV